MTFGSLFAGIGGLDLGLERAGWKPIWQVETEPYCVKILEKHWPEVERYGDIKGIEWEEVERPDLICGGFPCQPVSVAGKQLRQADGRWLWPEFRRCIRGVRPRFVLVENVPGLLTGGMGDVLGDLATLGYDAEWESLPAAAFGAPHLRYRVFIVAYASGAGARIQPGNAEASRQVRESARTPQPKMVRPGNGQSDAEGAVSGGEDVADTDEPRLGGRSEGVFSQEGWNGDPRYARASLGGNGSDGWWESEPNVCGVVDGISAGLDRMWPTPRASNIAESQETARKRMTRLRQEGRATGGVKTLANEVEKRNASQRMDTAEDPMPAPEAPLRALWERVAGGSTSQEPRSDGQLAGELADSLPELPYRRALENRQEAVAQASSFLHSLRQACEEIGIVRDTSEPLAAAWLAAPEESQAWAYLAACRGGWVTEWPNVPRVSKSVPARVDRLRSLGNAVVPQVAEWIGRRILDQKKRGER